MNTDRFHITPRLWVLLFFAGYLALGLLIYDDYGLSWDDPTQRAIGLLNVLYVFEGNPLLLSFGDRYYGPVFEMLLSLIEQWVIGDNLRAIYLMRHLVTFLLFYVSVIAFYALCKKRFDSWKVGLLGSFFLITSPRIFADSFYNTKDLPFLSVFLMSIYTLMRCLEQFTLPRVLLHALLCALLVNIRIPGLLVPFLTVVFITVNLIVATPRPPIKSTLLLSGVYGICLVGLSILLFPVAWDNPLHHFMQAFATMKQYLWVPKALYFGRFLTAAELPWHYLPVWIGITTPLLYLAGFMIGLLTFLAEFCAHPVAVYRTPQGRSDLLGASWCLLPILLIVALQATIYDGWRHVFFIYPAMVFLALRGLIVIRRLVARRVSEHIRPRLSLLWGVLIGISLIGPLTFMIRYHPYQHVYFNALAGNDMQRIKQQFDLDYWGLSYRAGLEFLTRKVPDTPIRLYDVNMSAEYRLHILEEADRNRILLVNTPEDADYFISNYRWHPDEYPYQNEIFSVNIRGAKILVVYKLR